MYQEGASCFFIQTNRFHSGRRKKHGQLASIVVVRKECREEILRPGSSTSFIIFRAIEHLRGKTERATERTVGNTDGGLRVRREMSKPLNRLRDKGSELRTTGC